MGVIEKGENMNRGHRGGSRPRIAPPRSALTKGPSRVFPSPTRSARAPTRTRKTNTRPSGSQAIIVPNKMMAETKVPGSNPGIIGMYALNYKQGLLAKLRCNRLIDIFTGVACYSLQSHLRTNVPSLGQVETDEIYIGVDKRGAHYVFPVQAKGGKDLISVVQIEQDIAVCAVKFPSLICRPIAAQFMADDLIALFELEDGEQGVAISSEKHYRLVPGEEVTADDLKAYGKRQD